MNRPGLSALFYGIFLALAAGTLVAICTRSQKFTIIGAATMSLSFAASIACDRKSS